MSCQTDSSVSRSSKVEVSSSSSVHSRPEKLNDRGDRHEQLLLVMAALRDGFCTPETAAKRVGLSRRQVARLFKRYCAEGERGLVHRNCGKPSNNRTSAHTIRTAVEIYQREYGHLGPTAASTALRTEHCLNINRETLRRLLLQRGLWQPTRRRRSPAFGSRRECFGELVWIDVRAECPGVSHSERCVAIAVDDATETALPFMSVHDDSTTRLRLLRSWILRHGIPQQVNLVVRNRSKPSPFSSDSREDGQSTLESACEKLGIEFATVTTDDRKLRPPTEHQITSVVDHMSQSVRQDANITLSLLEQATRDLIRPPRCRDDAHAPVFDPVTVSRILGTETQVRLGPGQTLVINNETYQHHGSHASSDLEEGVSISVFEGVAGQLAFSRDGQELEFTAQAVQVEAITSRVRSA